MQNERTGARRLRPSKLESWSLPRLLLDDGDDGEDAEGGERVGDDVVEQRGEALLGVGHDGEQHVAGVGDGGVGEQAAEAGLADGDEVSQQHRERGHQREHGNPAADEMAAERRCLLRPRNRAP